MLYLPFRELTPFGPCAVADRNQIERTLTRKRCMEHLLLWSLLRQALHPRLRVSAHKNRTPGCGFRGAETSLQTVRQVRENLLDQVIIQFFSNVGTDVNGCSPFIAFPGERLAPIHFQNFGIGRLFFGWLYF